MFADGSHCEKPKLEEVALRLSLELVVKQGSAHLEDDGRLRLQREQVLEHIYDCFIYHIFIET